jgi:ribosomal-protein-alanine N-acetyltransferase
MALTKVPAWPFSIWVWRWRSGVEGPQTVLHVQVMKRGRAGTCPAPAVQGSDQSRRYRRSSFCTIAGYRLAAPCDPADVADVALRPISEHDLPFLDRLENDPDALGEFEWSGYGQVGRLSRQWNEDRLISANSGHLAVAAEDVVTGIATWRAVSRGGPEGVCFEIGVALLPEHRGRGIGRAAHRLLVDYLFGYTRVERLEALTDEENLAERRVLEIVGFRQEGVLRHAVWQRANWRDLVLYALLRNE